MIDLTCRLCAGSGGPLQVHAALFPVGQDLLVADCIAFPGPLPDFPFHFIGRCVDGAGQHAGGFQLVGQGVQLAYDFLDFRLFVNLYHAFAHDLTASSVMASIPASSVQSATRNRRPSK